MPDDDVIIEETPVTEQEEKPDLPADEAAGFASEKDDDIDEGTEGLTDPDEKIPETDKEPEKKPEKKPEKDPEAEEEDTDTKEDVDTDEEEDEDIARGKDVIAEEEKTAAEKKIAEDAEKAEKRETGGYNPFRERHDAESIEFFKGVIPEGIFPDKVTLKDGTDLDFKGVLENDPEIPVMVTVIANNIIRQLMANKVLATHDDLDAAAEAVDNILFERTVTNRFDGVPDAKKIYQAPEFKKWVGEQPKEIQALMKSSNPYDHIRVFKRYLNKSGLESADKTVAEVDKKRKAAKERADGILKSTVRSKSAKPKGATLTPREEEKEGFNSKEDDDDF